MTNNEREATRADVSEIPDAPIDPRQGGSPGQERPGFGALTNPSFAIPKATQEVTATGPDDLDFVDGEGQIVLQTRERAAAEYASRTIYCPLGTPVLVVGADDFRTRLVVAVNDASNLANGVRVGSYGDVNSGQGFTLTAVPLETKVKGAIYAVAFGTSMSLSVWSERDA